MAQHIPVLTPAQRVRPQAQPRPGTMPGALQGDAAQTPSLPGLRPNPDHSPASLTRMAWAEGGSLAGLHHRKFNSNL